jgi:hypothetical protein
MAEPHQLPEARPMKAPLRYLVNKVLFWRRCWWCKWSGFGAWPMRVEPEAVCHLLSKSERVVTVAPTEFCSRWEGGKDDDQR